MSAPVATVGMDDSLQTARAALKSKGIHHVVVVERGRVTGVISDRDILRAMSPFVDNLMLERPCDRETMTRRVHQIMSREPVTIGPDASIQLAAVTLLQSRVSCLPVVDAAGKLRGIVTTRDLLRHLIDPAALLAGQGSAGAELE